MSRIKAAPADEVLRCEECGRILVRTAESGL
jgi:predicted  nucleic acid-binding Zn-ribbon protein